MVERMCDGKEGSQCEENFGVISNLNLNKKTLPGVKPWECSVCGKIFMHHSSQNMHIRYQTGHKPHEYQTYGVKPDKCNECGRAFCYLQCF